MTDNTGDPIDLTEYNYEDLFRKALAMKYVLMPHRAGGFCLLHTETANRLTYATLAQVNVYLTKTAKSWEVSI